ncbi:hypothetical protein BVY04_00995 [bacterium M21]|nr:hypothetical protein BVY04_00995 [bacterium M21]
MLRAIGAPARMQSHVVNKIRLIMKKHVKKIAGKLWSALPGSPQGANIPILCYHSVNNGYCAEADPVSVELFDKHLRYLKENYSVVSLRDVADHLIDGLDLPDNPVAISFDDGYLDNYLYVFPLLKQHELHATIFVVSAFLNREVQLLPVNGWESFSWEQAREMAASGFVGFGAHTHNHHILTSLDRKQVKTEIEQSRDHIQRELGQTPTLFAYPNGQGGDIPEYSAEVLESLGFKAAFSTFWRTYHLPGEIMRINRVMIHGSDSLDTFKLKLEGAYDYIFHLHRAKAGAFSDNGMIVT